MSGKSERFRKGERLCSKKSFEDLFSKGHSFYHFPYQVIWAPAGKDIPSPAQVAFSVSKRNFKKAVDRNLIKRRLRESWRRDKHVLYEFLERKNLQIVFIVIYKDVRIPSYAEVEKELAQAVKKLISGLSHDPQIC